MVKDLELGYLSLTTLRAICAILEEEGNVLRDDIKGFLRAMEDAPDCLLQIGPHSIALAPTVDDLVTYLADRVVN